MKQYREPGILIIDDMESSRVALRLTLERGYTFFEAESAEKGLEILEKNSEVDLILLDLLMPGMSGLDFLKKIKKMEKLADIPVIVCTADENESMEEDALKNGAEDYLIKPFKPAVVRQRVINTLTRKNLEKQLKKVKINKEVQKLADNLPIGIGVFEIGQKEMRPTCVNKKAMELFRMDEKNQNSLCDRDHMAFVELDRHDLNRIMSAGKEVTINHVYKAHRADGTPFQMKSIARLLPGKDGTLNCYTTITDISDTNS